MTLSGFLLMLLIAAIAGAIGQTLAGYSFGGCVTAVVVGFLGAYIGTWIASQFHLPEFFVIMIDGKAFPLFWSVIGSALLSAVLGLLSRRR